MQASKVVNLVSNSLDFHQSLVKGTRAGYQSKQISAHSPTSGRGVVANGQQLNFTPSVSVNQFTGSQPRGSALCTITVVGAYANVAAGVAAVANKLGFNSLPLNRSINTSVCRLNGTMNVPDNPRDNVEPLLYSLNQTELKELGVGAVPETGYNFDHTVLTGVLRGTLDSKSYGRGYTSFQVESVTLDGGSLVIAVRVYEKLLMRPFQTVEKHAPHFPGLSDLTISLNMVSDLANTMLAYNDIDNDPAVTLAVSDFQIHLEQGTPHVNVPVPTVAYYNIPQYNHQLSDSDTITANGSNVFRTNNMIYQSVPKAFFIYATATTRLANAPQRLYPITNVKLNFNLKRNLLQNYSVNDLYEMSRKHGLNMSFAQFTGGTQETGLFSAGPVIVAPSDFDTQLFEQSNIATQVNFSVECTVANKSSANEDVTLHVCAMNDVYLKYENGSYSEELATIMVDEMAKAENTFIKTSFQNDILGGSIWGKIKHFVSRAVRNPIFKAITKEVRNLPAVSKFVGDNSTIGRFAKRHGYGKPKGKGIVHLAGKQLSHSEILRALNQ